MPVRGKKPDPTSLRTLKGNSCHSRKPNRDEPQPPLLTNNDPPEELDGNVVAIREWLRLAPMLRSIRQITHADRASLISLCLEWSRYLALQSDTSANGQRQRRYALHFCLRLWPELGLTPSSRARVHTASLPAPADDPFAEFDRGEETTDDTPAH